MSFSSILAILFSVHALQSIVYWWLNSPDDLGMSDAYLGAAFMSVFVVGLLSFDMFVVDSSSFLGWPSKSLLYSFVLLRCVVGLLFGFMLGLGALFGLGGQSPLDFVQRFSHFQMWFWAWPWFLFAVTIVWSLASSVLFFRKSSRY